MKINFYQKLFKITSFIVLSTNIFACSELKNERVTQPEIKQSGNSAIAKNSIEKPAWNNIDIQTLTGHSDAIWSVAINPQQNLIATASEDNTIKLWNAKTGKLVRTLKGHTKGVLSISFSPDGERLASSSKEGIIKIWQVETGEIEPDCNRN